MSKVLKIQKNNTKENCQSDDGDHFSRSSIKHVWWCDRARFCVYILPIITNLKKRKRKKKEKTNSYLLVTILFFA